MCKAPLLPRSDPLQRSPAALGSFALCTSLGLAPAWQQPPDNQPKSFVLFSMYIPRTAEKNPSHPGPWIPRVGHYGSRQPGAGAQGVSRQAVHQLGRPGSPRILASPAPTFHFRDLGVVNHLTHRSAVKPGSELLGKAFENWPMSFPPMHATRRRITTYRFGDSRAASKWTSCSDMPLWPVEARGKPRITGTDLKGLIHFKKECPSVQYRLLVCLEQRRRKPEEGIHILPYQDFVESLWAGEWTSDPG